MTSHETATTPADTAAASRSAVPMSPLDRETAHFEPSLSDAIGRVVRSGYYVGGPEVASFTQAFAAYCGVAHGVGVGNGTDAIEIALRAAGVERGDEVITVANAGGYSTTAILAIGATPVYADINPETLLVDPASASALTRDKTRAIVVTHLYGGVVDVDAVRAAVGEGVAVIEDCAQAHGATLRGRLVGSLGDIAAFSFYPTKNLGALGDAGAVVTNDEQLAATATAIAQYGWTERYHATLGGGRNSRLDPMQAAVLGVKLPELDAMNTRRREIASRYDGALSGVGGVRLVQSALPDERTSVFHLAILDCDDRNAVAAALQLADVQTAVHYPVADHHQAAYAGRFSVPADGLPATDRATSRILTVPCHPLLTDAEVDRVCDALGGLKGATDE